MSDYKITREEYEDAQNVVWDYEEQLKAEVNEADKSSEPALHKHIVSKRYSEKDMDDAYDKGFKDGVNSYNNIT